MVLAPLKNESQRVDCVYREHYTGICRAYNNAMLLFPGRRVPVINGMQDQSLESFLCFNILDIFQ